MKIQRLETNYMDTINILEKSMNIVKDLESKPQEISILEKFGDVYISTYITEEKAEIKNLELAEDNYLECF